MVGVVRLEVFYGEGDHGQIGVAAKFQKEQSCVGV